MNSSGRTSGEEEFRIDVAGRGRVEVLHGALGYLLDGGAAARAGAEVNGAAEGGGIEGDAGYGGGDVIHGHDVEHGVRDSRERCARGHGSRF